jgi:hypothetical protein
MVLPLGEEDGRPPFLEGSDHVIQDQLVALLLGGECCVELLNAGLLGGCRSLYVHPENSVIRIGRLVRSHQDGDPRLDLDAFRKATRVHHRDREPVEVDVTDLPVTAREAGPVPGSSPRHVVASTDASAG